MAAINLEDLLQAQKNYMQARDQALQAASAQSDPQVVLLAQQASLVKYLQARVKLLNDAKSQTMQQYDDEIGQYQVKIGQLNQQILEANQAPASAPTDARSADATSEGGQVGTASASGAPSKTATKKAQTGNKT